MSLVVFCILIIVFYLLLSYFSFSKYEKEINNLQNKISLDLDERFKLFENLINGVSKIIDYEQTFLKEIVQLRSQAQKFKQEKDIKNEMLCEEKISKLANQINRIFDEFPLLKQIKNHTDIKQEILLKEQLLLDEKLFLNHLILKFNKRKSNVFNIIIVNLFPKFSKHIDFWKLS